MYDAKTSEMGSYLTLKGPRRVFVDSDVAAAAGLALGPTYAMPSILTIGRLRGIGAADPTAAGGEPAGQGSA